MNLADVTTARRWPVISALGIVQIFAWGSSYYLLAVLAAPIANDTGWPLSWIVGGLSLGLLVAGIASPRVGVAIRQRGGRAVLALSAILLASGLTILATAPNLPVYVVGWMVIGVGMGAGLYDAAFATLSELYGREARAAITSLTLWGGFASTVCWPLSAYLMGLFGWRGVCITYAAIQVGLCLPLILFCLPRGGRAPVQSARSDNVLQLSRGERSAYHLLTAIMVLAGLTSAIVSVHLLVMLQGRGLSLADAVWAGTLLGPAQVAARLLEMANRGRHHPIWTMTAAITLTASGLTLLFLGLPAVAFAVFTYGAGNGIFSIARGALPLVVFGSDRYPTIMGRMARPSLIAQAVAPATAAILIGAVGVESLLALLSTLALANVGLVLLMWKSVEL